MSPFFWVDDFYLFGILPAKLDGVIHQRLNKNISLDQWYAEKGGVFPFTIGR
jgi:hypothetical protein